MEVSFYLFEIFLAIDWYVSVLLSLTLVCYGLILYKVFFYDYGIKNKCIIRAIVLQVLVILFFESTLLFEFTVVSVLSSLMVFSLFGAGNRIAA